MINFNVDSSNRLLLNPKSSDHEKNLLAELKYEFEKHFGSTGYFLLASSGSSQKDNESIKLIALHVEKILNSARRFNQYFKAGEHDHWGLVLPEFHVAGLGIRARAFLAGSRVFEQSWNADQLALWILENQISYISMVPTQIFDLVQKQIRAPDSVKKIFVGASVLSQELRTKALQLNWPIIETYGMTETASMIAVKEAELFCVLPGVEVKVDSDLLSIKCNSLLTATVQKKNGQIVVEAVPENSWFPTQDRAQVVLADDEVYLKFLGRTTDYIKILGEGVSLAELRNQLLKLMFSKKIESSQFELLALPDTRAGYKLVLAVENHLNRERGNELMNLYNRGCRPYEKIAQCIVVGQIPRTSLGKLKTEELKRIVNEELNRGS